VPSAAAGQERKPLVVSAEGHEFFGHVLSSAGLKPVRSIHDLGRIEHKDLVIVVFGELTVLESIEANLGAELEVFAEQGGAVLIASDRVGPRRYFRTGFPGGDNTIFAKIPHRYQDLRRCPLVKAENCVDARHPLFARLFLGGQGIATNSPSLLHVPATGEPKALVRFAGLGGALVAAPGADDARRFLLIGGHGMFMNQMMAPPELDNYDFAVNAADWLRDGQRRYVLFVNEGTVIERISLIPPVNFMDLVNRGVDLLQRQLDRVQTERADDFARVLPLLATGLVLLYGLKRFIGNRYQTEQPALAIGVVTQAAPESVALGRIEQMAAKGHCWEATQVLIRRFFRGEAGIELPFPLTGLTPPSVAYRASAWERWRLQGMLARVWSLARRSPMEPASAGEVARLRIDLDALAEAVRAGKLVFPSTARDKTTL
jgi:hypothetical protein